MTETTADSSHSWAYQYTTIGRLRQVFKDSQLIRHIEYDRNGNDTLTFGPSGTSVSATHDAQDRLTAHGSTTYQYNASGDLVSKRDGADTTRYNYNAIGNLVDVLLPDSTTITYRIDGRNRRVGKLIDSVLVQQWVYQGALNVLAELDGGGDVVNRYVYGTKPHVPDYVVHGDSTYRIISDHIGSVRLVVNVESGTIAQAIDYDAWGNVLSNSNPTFQSLGFAGGLSDNQTELVRCGARDYAPSIGRWVAKDPALFVAGDANVYAYCGADPINNIDPSGLDAYVTLYFGAGGLGHIGIGINTTATTGYYPAAGGSAGRMLVGGVPGVLQPDTGVPIITIRIPTTADQDNRMMEFMEDFGDQRYAVFAGGQSCNGFVQKTLEAGGVKTMSPYVPDLLAIELSVRFGGYVPVYEKYGVYRMPPWR